MNSGDLAWLVGIPYGYRGDHGLDCYQLVREGLWLLFDIEAPDYEFNGEEDEAWIAFTAHKINWLPGDGSPGDVVMLQIGRYQHVGLCLEHGQMLHTMKGHNSAIEDYQSAKWRDRITGFYRCPT